MRRIVICTFSIVGFHLWKDAPPEVDYLKNEHRHLFNFKVEVSVEHADRDVEYHSLKRLCLGELALSTRTGSLEGADEYRFEGRSCEMIAEGLGASLKRKGLMGLRAIEVWEDNENGSRVEWP